MAMTIWIHTLEERKYSSFDEDHTQMNRHSDALDDLCRAAGVPTLSDFMDYTDLEYSMSEDDEDEVVDPETGLGYGIDDMAWYDAAKGLLTLKVLRDQLAGEGHGGLDAELAAQLIEELDHCMSVLEGPAARGAKFHLAVID
jgi:hypothetical protein